MLDTERYFTSLTIFIEGLYLILAMDFIEWTDPAFYHQN
ncbi:hypothetical protein ES703_105358 [subsurface metagenome]